MSEIDQAEPLDPLSHEPLYLQLAARLRALLDAGAYPAGSRLPSERELVDAFGVGRSTAIAALDELVRSHRAHRVKGRGTFATNPVISEFSLAVGFTEDLDQRGLRPVSRVLDLRTAAPDDEIVRRLHAPAGASMFRLVRLRMANDEPVALQTAYLPVALYPDLDRHRSRLDRLYALMRDTYRQVPLWAEAVVEVRLASPEEADLLEVTARDPVALVWHLTLDAQYRPLEYVKSIYRADRFTFASGRTRIGPDS